MAPSNISLEQTAREIACGFAKVGDGLTWPSSRGGLSAPVRAYQISLDGWLSERGLPRAAAQLNCYPAYASPCAVIRSRRKAYGLRSDHGRSTGTPPVGFMSFPLAWRTGCHLCVLLGPVLVRRWTTEPSPTPQPVRALVRAATIASRRESHNNCQQFWQIARAPGLHPY